MDSFLRLTLHTDVDGPEADYVGYEPVEIPCTGEWWTTETSEAGETVALVNKREISFPHCAATSSRALRYCAVAIDGVVLFWAPIGSAWGGVCPSLGMQIYFEPQALRIPRVRNDPTVERFVVRLYSGDPATGGREASYAGYRPLVLTRPLLTPQ